MLFELKTLRDQFLNALDNIIITFHSHGVARDNTSLQPIHFPSFFFPEYINETKNYLWRYEESTSLITSVETKNRVRGTIFLMFFSSLSCLAQDG